MDRSDNVLFPENEPGKSVRKRARMPSPKPVFTRSQLRTHSCEALVRVPVLSFVLLACSAVVSAQVTLPKILSSHMVMQRDLPVHVWGMAAPGQSVTAAFRGESRTVTSDPLGHWNAYMKPGPAGGPFTLTVTPGPAPNSSASQ